MTKNYYLLIVALLCNLGLTAQVKANFSSQESSKEIYRNGFDNNADLAKWTLTSTNADYTWHIADKPQATTASAFSAINPSSTGSLAIWYDANQNEKIVSPEIDIPSGAKCNFYACFDGVYIMYANLTLVITVDGTDTVLFDALAWSQDSGHERPSWVPFSIDLSAYAGKKATFSFVYKGTYGDDALIDDFIITQTDDSENSTVTVKEGEAVHYTDLSTGTPTAWEWTFPGGTPATSTEQNPVVTYPSAGTYSATLKATNAEGEDSFTRTDYVTVNGISPTAKIGFPTNGYQSPWVACFVPANVELQFTDQSTGYPSSWQWQFKGASNESSTEQNPTVTYTKEGLYSASLRATNKTGYSDDICLQGIQVGGSQYIWNIDPSENDKLGAIALGWYGYYGGTNWLDIVAFAEHFDKPAKQGYISEVGIYFASTTTVTPEADIKVAIAKAENGLPGEELASATVKAKDLKYSDTTFELTKFTFSNPVAIDAEYFVTVSGFPNNTDESYKTDDIAMFCAPTRAAGEKSTTYQYLYDYDDNNKPIGEPYWIKNSDECTSFAVTPLFTFGEYTGLNTVVGEAADVDVTVAHGILSINASAPVIRTEVYNIAGQLVLGNDNGEPANVGDWTHGIYIVKVILNDSTSKTVKVVI